MADSLLAPRAGIDDPFAAAVHANRMSMIIVDAQAPDMPIVFANDAFLSMTGYARHEVIGRNCSFLQGPDTDAEAVMAVDLGFLVREAGGVDVGHAPDSASAVAMAKQLQPDIALVDVHLADGPTGVEAARQIAEGDGAIVLFMTANVKRLPEDLALSDQFMARWNVSQLVQAG